MDERHIRRGEVYYADLRPTVGSEQDCVRPVLVIQNDAENKRSPTVIVAAITSRQTKPHIPIKLLYLIHMEGIPDKENDRFTACGGNCRIPCDAKYTTSHVAEAI